MNVALDARKAYDGGIGRYIRSLTHALLAVSPSLRLTLLMPRGMADWLPRGPRVDRVDHDAGLYSVTELWRTAALVRRLSPDVFHAPHYVVSFPLPERTIVTVHDLIHVQGPSRFRNPVKRAYASWMIRTAARRSAHVLTVSEATKGALLPFAGVPGTHVTSVPLGVDERFFVPPPCERGEVPYCLYVGASKPHKNVPLLLRAFAHAHVPHARLVTVTTLTPELVALGTSLGIGDRWQNLDAVPDEALPALYAGARVTVVPSTVEGFGLPLLEAMAAGSPVIATRVASLPEVGGDVPLYVDPDAPEALAEVLRRVWRGEGDTRERVRSGIERARTFTWHRTALSTLGVYERVSRR